MGRMNKVSCKILTLHILKMDNQEKKIEIPSLASQLQKAEEEYRGDGGKENVQTFTDFVEDLGRSGIEERALKVSDTAPDFTLKNAVGDDINLSAVLKSGPVILTWYRGRWCPFCNLQLNYLSRYLPDFQKNGASLIALSPELPDKSLSTWDKNELPFEVLTDVDNNVARKYGGVHALNDKVKGIYAQMSVYGYYRGEINELPVPATYIIDSQLVVRYAFVESDYHKRAEPAELLSVLQHMA